ncbi:23S rRNA (guanine1835-N2)-methyltransferase [Izhakiella capsodis]|uniref:Ribosomal RNA large subunit methyltransferase G n=1 Tax=Izhakiella capsodis TaxID=1367852 RepID=A0A1I4XCS9_9GAMM|nr:23S rRNA (guanine(1835)-N(2))-methyltransferase RlmG [Izhakiella capsodis]SFN23313.1 23S rRNA (guanine1835-N2)-methyltransferase [Izhakiella capsodis]
MSHSVYSLENLTLQRFPLQREESPLQAWEAADELLLQQLEGPAVGPTLIFNDSFGALACACHSDDPFSISDSLLSLLATRQNLQHNHLSPEAVTLLDSLSALPEAPSRVLIKIPKTLALLEQQLRALRKVVTPQTHIIAAAKAKEIHRSTLQLFERTLGRTTTSLAWKKARLIFCQWQAPLLPEDEMIQRWQLDSGETIANHASVFARSGLDIGARFFMQHLPQNLSGEIIDLGCGNGVIGLVALRNNPLARVHFVDESWMAVASSRMNIELNQPESLARSQFSVNHALSGFAANSAKAVLCNPPFHQQNALTDHIAWQMFRDARRCLLCGGELRVVGNRHLDYHHKLKKLFGNCQLVASNKKFVVLRCVKLP